MRRTVRLMGLTPGLLAIGAYLFAAWEAAGGNVGPMICVGVAFIVAALWDGWPLRS